MTEVAAMPTNAASTMTGREWHLVRRPHAQASLDDFALVDTDVPDPGPGQVVVRNTHLTVDPFIRGRMDDRPSYISPFGSNAPLDGAAVGVVLKRATAHGLLVTDHLHRMRDFRAEMRPWLRTGRIVHRQTVLDGSERAPDALLGLLRSGTPMTGKAIIRLEAAS